LASYREFPRRGWALITRILYLVAAATATGSLIGFLLIVFVSIVGTEVVGFLWRDVSGDAMMRAGISVTSITGVASIGLVVVFLGLSRLAYARQLASIAEREGHVALPLPRELTVLRLTNPFFPQYFFTLFFVIIDPLMLLALLWLRHEHLGTPQPHRRVTVAFTASPARHGRSSVARANRSHQREHDRIGRRRCSVPSGRLPSQAGSTR